MFSDTEQIVVGSCCITSSACDGPVSATNPLMYLLSITCFTTSETLKNVTGSKPFEVLTKSLGVVITCAIWSKTVLKTLVGTLITIISEKSIAF